MRARRFFIVFTERSVAIEPCKGSLNNPPLRNNRKAVFYLFTDMHGSIPSLTNIVDESAPVASIRTNGLVARDFPEDFVCQIKPSDSIGNIGCMDVNAPNTSLSVHGNLTASTFDLLAAMKAYSISFVVGFKTL